MIQVQVRFPTKRAKQIVERAAKAKDVSVNKYILRAILEQAQRDLTVDVVVSNEGKVRAADGGALPKEETPINIVGTFAEKAS